MKHNKGFTLIEVLVTALLLSISLLGLVGLQAAGMKNAHASYNRTQATHLAHSMADRMRANVANAGLFANSTYITVNPLSAVKTASCLATTGCTPVQMAENDLFEWNAGLQNTANGLIKTGAIIACSVPYDGLTCNATTVPPAVFVITINWGENRDDNKDTIIDADISFQTEFQL